MMRKRHERRNSTRCEKSSNSCAEHVHLFSRLCIHIVNYIKIQYSIPVLQAPCQLRNEIKRMRLVVATKSLMWWENSRRYTVWGQLLSKGSILLPRRWWESMGVDSGKE